MKAPDDVHTPKQYLAQVPVNRRAALEVVDALIRRVAPNLKPEICYGMIGYGVRPYETKSGCKGEWPMVALANQKRYMSLYLGCEGGEEGYIVEREKHRLGKVSTGKSCVRFTKLEDLNLEVVEELVAKVAGRD